MQGTMRRKQIITTGSRQRQRQVMLAALAAEHRVVRLSSEELTGRYKDIEEATASGRSREGENDHGKDA
jgi:hypothetical protein